MRQKEDAEVLRFGLVAGTVSVAKVVSWADQVIGAEVEPDRIILDVATSGRQHPAEVASLLRGVPGEADPVRVMRRVLGTMLQALQDNPSRAAEIARALYRLVSDGDLPSAVFGSEPYGLDDAFELARQGVYGTHAEAVADLRSYLEQHAELATE